MFKQPESIPIMDESIPIMEESFPIMEESIFEPLSVAESVDASSPGSVLLEHAGVDIAMPPTTRT